MLNHFKNVSSSKYNYPKIKSLFTKENHGNNLNPSFCSLISILKQAGLTFKQGSGHPTLLYLGKAGSSVINQVFLQDDSLRCHFIHPYITLMASPLSFSLPSYISTRSRMPQWWEKYLVSGKAQQVQVFNKVNYYFFKAFELLNFILGRCIF